MDKIGTDGACFDLSQIYQQQYWSSKFTCAVMIDIS